MHKYTGSCSAELSSRNFWQDSTGTPELCTFALRQNPAISNYYTKISTYGSTASLFQGSTKQVPFIAQNILTSAHNGTRTNMVAKADLPTVTTPTPTGELVKIPSVLSNLTRNNTYTHARISVKDRLSESESGKLAFGKILMGQSGRFDSSSFAVGDGVSTKFGRFDAENVLGQVVGDIQACIYVCIACWVLYACYVCMYVCMCLDMYMHRYQFESNC